MTLKEAYEQWGQLKERQTLYVKTRNAFSHVWKMLDLNTPCDRLTLTVLRETLEKRGPVFDQDKARAASVMVHVLNFAHKQDPQGCPLPTFCYNDLLKEDIARKVLKIERKLPEIAQKLPKIEQKLPDMKPRKQTRVTPKTPYQGLQDTLGRSKNRAKRKVAQIDPSTQKVVRVWESMGAAEHGLGIKNISRAIDKKRLAGGFYWCDEKDVASFEPKEDRRGRKTAAAMPQPTEKEADNPALNGGAQDEATSEEADSTTERGDAVERGIDDFIGGFGHGTVQPGKSAVMPTLEQFTDKQMIDELQKRGWEGVVTLKIDNVEVKITL